MNNMSRFLKSGKRVLYDPLTGEYVDQFCKGTTTTRFDAWTGTPQQAENAREKFNLPDRFLLYVDGNEKDERSLA